MSYQVLARKYRPASFAELEGQEHVQRALINALEQNQLHHAYLFTGTRGTGKTTIARIFAKCLNCEVGVTATPCGTCSSCEEIAQGRSVDLIEVDAASRTGVDSTRELLDNVQYLPTHSRYKVYLIDEVHMFSASSFNALLKTLEEPPEHVKFLLATTDPKKLPITVLSRCLQFNLKNLSPERVVNYLTQVLGKEQVPFEEPALWQLGRAADGSMRDALSLTDQALAFGNNSLTASDVQTMLGTIDLAEVQRLVLALASGDGGRLLAGVAELAEYAPDYDGLLADVLSLLHRVAVAQTVPEGIDNSRGDREAVMALAKQLSPEDVQLYYQIGLIGQRDLPLAPDMRSGFEMVMLRMLAFVPNQEVVPNQEAPCGGQDQGAAREASDAVKKPEAAADARAVLQPAADTQPGTSDRSLPPLAPEHWPQILVELQLNGVTLSVAGNCELAGVSGDVCDLRLSERHSSLWNKSHEERIARSLSACYDRPLSVRLTLGDTRRETPAEVALRHEAERRLQAERAIDADEALKQLIDRFDGTLDRGSIMPRSQSGE